MTLTQWLLTVLIGVLTVFAVCVARVAFPRKPKPVTFADIDAEERRGWLLNKREDCLRNELRCIELERQLADAKKRNGQPAQVFDISRRRP